MSEKPNSERSFEENLAELEAIVRELEDGKTTLETAIERYEQGVRLLASCTQLLRRAEQKILLLTGTDASGEPQLEDFAHNSSDERRQPG